MKRILLGTLALVSSLTFGATLNPVQLLNPAGSTAGQAIVSTGSTTPPAWGSLGLGNVSGTLGIANGGTSATTATAARTNLGLGSAATFNTGTSGATVPLMSTANTWSGAQTVSAALSATGNDALLYSNTSAQSIPSGTATTVTGWTKISDRLNANFNATTGTFTAPATGVYQVGGQVTFGTAAGVLQASYQASVIANGVNIATSLFQQSATTTTTVSVPIPSVVVALAAGQTIVIQATQGTGVARVLSSTAIYTFLSIARLP